MDRAENGKGPGDEFVAKQLTAGAWFFGVLCVTFLAASAYLETFYG